MKRTAFALTVLTALIGCVSAPAPEEKPIIFYPSLPERPRLQFLHGITTEDDLGGKKQSSFDEFLLGKTPSTKRLAYPYDIGSSKTKLYILDRRAKKLLILDLAKKEFDYLRDRRMGVLRDPSGIWITEDDIKYVADMGRKQVVAFGRDNGYLRAYGDKELLERPVDVAVYGDNVYICDMNKSQILVFDKDSGKHMRTIGKPGKTEGDLHKPTHITVDHDGNLFVNDAFNFRVQKFDPNGSFIKSFGKLGDSSGSFARPKGLAIDREGHLFVADAAFENVQIFDSRSGQLLLFFGGKGAAPGSMYLPAGVHIDYANVEHFDEFADKEFRVKYLFYVLNRFGRNRLNVYGFGEWIGPPPAGE